MIWRQWIWLKMSSRKAIMMTSNVTIACLSTVAVAPDVLLATVLHVISPQNLLG
jgi:hypothetical protein